MTFAMKFLWIILVLPSFGVEYDVVIDLANTENDVSMSITTSYSTPNCQDYEVLANRAEPAGRGINISLRVLAQVGFGRSYLRNSRLCHQWNCINQKLGLPDDLPPRDQFSNVFKALLPEGDWQVSADKVLDVCYGRNRSKRYTNTCPGQALIHCVVDQMVENCVEDSWRKNDACSNVFSLAGLKYMFSQSVYEDMEKNLPKETRPAWFMHNYFDTKCCNLPEMFNATVLGECGFTGFMNYYTHSPKNTTPVIADKSKTPANLNTVQNGDGDKVKVVDLAQFDKTDESTDPLDCCDMDGFIQPSWRLECDFHMSFEGQNRLVVKDGTPMNSESTTTTSTQRPAVVKDLLLVPESCEKETCVFSKLNIVSDAGIVNRDAYLKMLDNVTDAHPSWTNAKARVVTKCLSKPRLSEYDSECEINRILACTFDVLTENCPFARKSDPCRHHKDKTGCQISSSKYRPKNRREICLLPELLDRDHLSGCGINSLYRADHVTVEFPLPRKHGWTTSKYTCKDLTQPTRCLMSKMSILNKYSFMDYFQIKEKIRRFTEVPEWTALTDVYLSAFTNVPMYREYCSSQKKLLNVLDAMLMTCPISNRKTTPQCNKIFTDMTNASPVSQNITREKHDQILKHFQHLFMPEVHMSTSSSRIIRQMDTKLVKRPLYNYATLLNTGIEPQVKYTENLKDNQNSKPLVLLPVYLRPPRYSSLHHHDSNLRGNPFWLHTQIGIAHNSPKTSNLNNSTTSPIINGGNPVNKMV